MTTSSDSILTVTEDTAHAGFFITADFSAVVPAPTINMIKDPSGEHDGTPRLTNLSNSTITAQFAANNGVGAGSWVTRQQATAAGTMTARTTEAAYIRPGAQYTVSYYSKALSTARSTKIAIAWYDANNTYISTSTAGTAVTNKTTAYTRISCTATAPSNATLARGEVTVTSAASGEQHNWDALQVEAGGLTDFCSGDVAGCAWIGDGSNSVSVRPAYDSITVTRADGTIVAGLQNATAPGGQVRGYDNQTGLGAAVTYTATCTNGLTTFTSTTATVTSSIASNASWLKSLYSPALSVQLEVSQAPDWSDDVSTGLAYPLGFTGSSGVAYPIAVQGLRQADRGTLTVDCETRAARDDLLALLRSQGPFLLQLASNSGEPDVYVVAGAVQRSWAVQVASEPWRTVSIPLTVVAAPPQDGMTVAIPGHTYADSLANAPLYSNRTGTYWSR